MLESYRASGRCGPTFYLVTLGLLVFAAAAGWMYQRVVEALPIVFVTGALTVGFGLVLTVLLRRVLRLGHCRNAVAAIGAGLLVAGTALAVSHVAAFVFWQADVLELIESEQLPPYRAEGASEDDVNRYRDELRAHVEENYGAAAYLDGRIGGGWAVGEKGGELEVTGMLVWVIWIVEAGILLVAGLLGGRALGKDAYCEACGRRADTLHDRILVGTPRRADVAAIRKATSAETLFPGGTSRFDPASTQLLHEWKACSVCGRGFLDVVLLTHVPNDKGEVKTERETLHSNLLVTDEVRGAFEAASAVARAAEKAALTPRAQDAAEPR